MDHSQCKSIPIRSGDGVEEFGGLDSEGFGESLQVEKAGIAQSPFKMADVGSVESGRSCQVLLGHFPCVARLANETAKFLESGMRSGTRGHAGDFSPYQAAWP